MTPEQVYDQKIAPLIQEIVEICQKSQIPMIAAFQLHAIQTYSFVYLLIYIFDRLNYSCSHSSTTNPSSLVNVILAWSSNISFTISSRLVNSRDNSLRSSASCDSPFNS